MTTATDGKSSYFSFESNAFDENFDQLAKNTDKAVEETRTSNLSLLNYYNKLDFYLFFILLSIFY